MGKEKKEKKSDVVVALLNLVHGRLCLLAMTFVISERLQSFSFFVHSAPSFQQWDISIASAARVLIGLAQPRSAPPCLCRMHDLRIDVCMFFFPAANLVKSG